MSCNKAVFCPLTDLVETPGVDSTSPTQFTPKRILAPCNQGLSCGHRKFRFNFMPFLTLSTWISRGRMIAQRRAGVLGQRTYVPTRPRAASFVSSFHLFLRGTSNFLHLLTKNGKMRFTQNTPASILLIFTPKLLHNQQNIRVKGYLWDGTGTSGIEVKHLRCNLHFGGKGRKYIQQSLYFSSCVLLLHILYLISYKLLIINCSL